MGSEIPHGGVNWPVGHEPLGADVYARNTTDAAAPVEAVWSWLVQPDRWNAFYRNALRVRHVAGPWPRLALGSEFSWITFGAPVTTTVTECDPPHRLGWTGRGLGATGHHGWLLEPAATGCRILTEETQRGIAVRLLRPVLAPAMRTMHQRWVEGAAHIAESGRRP